jgi:hypothetical protein
VIVPDAAMIERESYEPLVTVVEDNVFPANVEEFA